MDISRIGAGAQAVLTQAQTGDAVQLAVFKKAMQAEAAAAQQLIEALPAPAPLNPPHLGNSVDTHA
jgi:N-acetylglucosamine kinase-like BadF-type ATPase